MLILFDHGTPVPIRPFLREHKAETTSQRTPCLGSRPKPTPRQGPGSSRKRKQEALTKKAAPRRRTPKGPTPIRHVECGGLTPLCSLWARGLLDICKIHVEVVLDVNAVGAYSHHRLVERSFRFALKPACRTPRVLGGFTHQTVLHRVAMHIVQSGQKRAWISEVRIPILKPDFAARSFVLTIDLLGCDGVQVPDQSRERLRLLFSYRHEVIVIWEDRPRLQLPAMLGRQLQEFLAEQGQALSGPEQRFLVVGCSGNHVRARAVQTVCRGVRPIRHCAGVYVRAVGKAKWRQASALQKWRMSMLVRLSFRLVHHHAASFHYPFHLVNRDIDV